MKKITLFILMTVCIATMSNAQYLDEGFESGTVPTGWTINSTNSGAYTWTIGDVFYSGAYSAQVEYDPSLATQDEDMVTPVLDLSSATNPELSFWISSSYFWGVDPNNNYDITISVDDGTSVTAVWNEDSYGEFLDYEYFNVIVDLTAYAGQSNIQLIFNYNGSDGAAVYIDEVKVRETPTAPECVTNEFPADGATDIQAGTLTLTWSAPTTGPTPTNYNIYFYDDAMGTNPVLVTSVTTETADIVISGFGDVVYWSVVPVNDGTQATGCDILSFTIQDAPGYCLTDSYGQYPSATYDATTTAVCDGSTANEITAFGWAAEYSMVTVESGQTYQFTSSVATDLLTISNEAGDTPLAYGTTPVTWLSNVDGNVRFYNHINDQCEGEQASRIRAVACGASLGVNENTLADKFTFYPNPVTDNLTVKASVKIDKAEVYNVLGKLVLEVQPRMDNGLISVDMNSLNSGVYFVKITSESSTRTIKVSKK